VSVGWEINDQSSIMALTANPVTSKRSASLDSILLASMHRDVTQGVQQPGSINQNNVIICHHHTDTDMTPKGLLFPNIASLTIVLRQ
jgi:hypothetical protein